MRVNLRQFQLSYAKSEEEDGKFDLKNAKQSQFISVQCSAFSGQRQDEKKEFEKTKPICQLVELT